MKYGTVDKVANSDSEIVSNGLSLDMYDIIADLLV